MVDFHSFLGVANCDLNDSSNKWKTEILVHFVIYGLLYIRMISFQLYIRMISFQRHTAPIEEALQMIA